jgi:hypothetical protein
MKSRPPVDFLSETVPGARLAGSVLVLGWSLLATAGCWGATPRDATPASEVRPYLRTSTNSEGSLVLEVAARAFRPEGCQETMIWLVAVTHLGSSNYFAGVQRFLDEQGLVLFEGVGATNGEFQVRSGKDHSLQRSLAAALGLRFQLEAIDYRGARFRNSDLTLAQIESLLAEHQAPTGTGDTKATGESQFHQLLDLLEGSGLAGTMARWGLGLIGSSQRLQALSKLALIELLGGLPADLTRLRALPGDVQRLVQVLIAERNRRVIRDLQSALREKPPPRSVAVLYGAGHMPDLERRLRVAEPCRAEGERWLPAFAVNPQAEGLSELERRWTRELVRRQLDGLGATLTVPDKLLLAPAYSGLPGFPSLGRLNDHAREHPSLDGSR